MSAYVSIRQHTSAYVGIQSWKTKVSAESRSRTCLDARLLHASEFVLLYQ
jgi:hypothetical protein